MADQRNLTFGIRFNSEDTVNGLEEVRDSVREITEETYEAENEINEFGSRAAASAGVAGAGFRRASEDADSFGSAVAKSAGESLKSYNSLPKAIKAGVDGGIGYAAKKTDSFIKKTVSGAGNISKAFRHPIQTIKDKLSSALEKAGTETKDTGSKAKEAEKDYKDMGDAGEKAGTGIKESIEGVAKKLVALKAGFEIVKKGVETVKNLGAALIEIGKSTQETNAKFNAVFDDKTVERWAENFAGAVNRSRTEVKSFLVSNKALYQEMGITGKEADQLSQITTSLAYDIGTALKIDDEESLSAVQDYIKGNTAALSQYGIQIDDALIKQTALNMGYGSNIDNLSEAQLAQIRMNTLLENSTSIQRQAAEEQTGYANNIKSLKSIITDFGEKASSKFSPLFDKITGSVLKSWTKIEPSLLKFIDYLGNGGIGAALPALVDMAASALPPFVDMLMQVFTAAEPIGGVIIGLATTALPPLVKALTPVVGVIGELAGTVLPPLGAIISKIAENVIPPFIQVVSTLNKTVITPLMPVITQIADAVLPAVSAGLQALSPLLELISPVLEVIGTVLGKIVGFLGKVAEYAAGGISNVIEKVAGFFGGGDSKAGADIPHNANGTENFAGGMTYINERGGEIAVLPSGSKVIPADKSERIVDNMSGESGSVHIVLDLNINVTGEVNENVVKELERAIQPIAEKVSEAVYKRMETRKIERQSIQDGLT